MDLIYLYLYHLLFFVINFICTQIYKFYFRKKEDSIKLSTDYEEICNRYNEEPLLKYNDAVYFPIVMLVTRKLKDKQFDIIINHSNATKVYTLPEEVEKYFNIDIVIRSKNQCELRK